MLRAVWTGDARRFQPTKHQPKRAAQHNLHGRKHTCAHMHTHAHTCAHMRTHAHTCAHMHTDPHARHLHTPSRSRQRHTTKKLQNAKNYAQRGGFNFNVPASNLGAARSVYRDVSCSLVRRRPPVPTNQTSAQTDRRAQPAQQRTHMCTHAYTRTHMCTHAHAPTPPAQAHALAQPAAAHALTQPAAARTQKVAKR